MDNQKMVVTLLLITIILSVLSVVVTLTLDTGILKSGGNVQPGPPVDEDASVSLVVQPAGGAAG